MKQWKKFLIGISAGLLLLPTLIPVQAAPANQPTISAESAMVVDAVNGQILYEKNALALGQVGNVSKLLSLLVIYDALDAGTIQLDDQVELSSAAYELSQDYNVANVPLRQDFQYSVAELLEAVNTGSANGALLALAEHVAGDQAAFQALMQAKVDSILADNSQIGPLEAAEWQALAPEIVNITGLPTNYQPNTGAVDLTKGKTNQLNAILLAVISYQLVQNHPEVLEATKLPKRLFREETDDQFELLNHNEMLAGGSHAYEGTEGLAVGVNQQATVVEVTNRKELRVITVVQGAKDAVTAYNDTKKILDYVYATYQLQRVVEAGAETRQLKQLAIFNGDPEQVSTYYMDTLNLVTPIIDTTPRFEYRLELDPAVLEEVDGVVKLKAELPANQVVGQMVASIKDTTLRFIPTSKSNHVPVAISQAVKPANFFVNWWRGTGKAVGDGVDGIRRFFTNLFN